MEWHGVYNAVRVFNILMGITIGCGFRRDFYVPPSLIRVEGVHGDYDSLVTRALDYFEKRHVLFGKRRLVRVRDVSGNGQGEKLVGRLENDRRLEGVAFLADPLGEYIEGGDFEIRIIGS